MAVIWPPANEYIAGNVVSTRDHVKVVAAGKGVPAMMRFTDVGRAGAVQAQRVITHYW